MIVVPSVESRVLRRFLLTTAALIAAVVAYAFVTAPPRRLVLAPPASGSPRTVLSGAYHVHTTRSDGAFTPEQVAGAARDAELQFVILTDHGDATRAPDPPRYVDGVLLIDAAEISVVEGHIVALGITSAAPYRLGGEARDVIDDIHRLGGIAIVAHPDSPRADLRWRGPGAAAGGRGGNPVNDFAGADGIEWLNADSEWRDERRLRILQTLITFPVRPAESLASLMARPVQSLRRWDALTRRRPVVALGATDAHGFGGRFYAQTFGTMAQVVELAAPATGNAAGDAAALVAAVRAGRAWSVVSAFAGPAIARLSARTAGGSAQMGGSLAVSNESVEITASIDGASNSRVSLWHHDREMAFGMGSAVFNGPAQPGAYRAEATISGFTMPWVVTNPVYLVPAMAPAATASASAPLPAPIEDDAVTPLTPAGEWVVEHGPTSEGSIARNVPDGGVRFRFRVGTVRPGLEYSALVRAMNDPLESFDRVEFIGSASAPMRVLVQFRLPGGVEGERWSRSVYLDPTPRAITVRMTEVVPVGFTPVPTRRPVVARVKSILFVLDTLNTAPGTSGEVVLKNVRLARGRESLSGPNREQQVRRPGQK